MMRKHKGIIIELNVRDIIARDYGSTFGVFAGTGIISSLTLKSFCNIKKGQSWGYSIRLGQLLEVLSLSQG